MKKRMRYIPVNKTRYFMSVNVMQCITYPIGCPRRRSQRDDPTLSNRCWRPFGTTAGKGQSQRRRAGGGDEGLKEGIIQSDVSRGLINGN